MNSSVWKKISVKAPIFIGVFMFLLGCENDIEQVKELTSKQDSAIITAKNITLIYSTEGVYKAQMDAPLLRRYVEEKKESKLYFPEGVEIQFFDAEGEKTSYIKANYSVYYESDGIWEAEDDVEAVNEKGEKLNTEYLVWNRDKKIIYSDQFVKITTEDGVLFGEKGFESDQEFNEWEIKGGSGIINMDRE